MKRFSQLKICITLFCILVVQTCYASNKLSLKEVLQSTEHYYPLIKASQKDILKAQGENIAAKGAFDPKFKSDYRSSLSGEYVNRYWDNRIEVPTPFYGTELFAGYRNGRGDFPTYDSNLSTNTRGEVRIGVGLPLLRDFAIDSSRAQLKKSELNIGLQNQYFILSRIDAIRSAGFAYWDWVGEGRKLDLTEHLLKLALIRQNALIKRYEHGDAAQIELVENQRLILQRRANLVLANRLFQRAAFNLSLFYRDGKGQPIIVNEQKLPETLPNVSETPTNIANWQSTQSRIIADHPAILSIKKQKAISQLDLALARNSLYPRLNARFYSAREYGQGDPLANQTSYNVGLNFEVPIFQRAARGNIQSTQYTLYRLSDQEQLSKDRIKVALDDSLNQLEADRQRVYLAKEEVRLATQVENAESIKFAQGDSSIFLVNEREQATFDSEVREINALVDYFKSEINLISSCGLEQQCIHYFNFNKLLLSQ